MTEVNEIDNKISDPKPLLKKNTIISGNHECMREFLISPLIDTVAWRKLYKTSLFSDIRFPKGKYHEDVWTTYKYIAKCNSIAIGKDHLYAYRKREGSIVNSNFTPKHLDGIEGSIKRYEFVSEQYPQLSNLAAVNIIYSANQCMFRLGKGKHIDNLHIEYLRKIYRKYLKFYIFGNNNSGIIQKIFALMARYCPKLLLKAIRILYGE